jgi:hypothetical protein
MIVAAFTIATLKAGKPPKLSRYDCKSYELKPLLAAMVAPRLLFLGMLE